MKKNNKYSPTTYERSINKHLSKIDKILESKN